MIDDPEMPPLGSDPDGEQGDDMRQVPPTPRPTPTPTPTPTPSGR